MKRRGRDRMVVGFRVVSSNPTLGRSVFDTALCKMFVSPLRQVCGFLWVSFTNQTNLHNIAEIFKVVLNINPL
jgi:hypothetical protein